MPDTDPHNAKHDQHEHDIQSLVNQYGRLDSAQRRHATRLTSLEEKTAHHEELLTSRCARGGLVRTNRGMERSHRRITELSRTLHGRLDVLEQALQAANQGGYRSFLTTLRARGMSDEQIREALTILTEDGELELTNDELFSELLTDYSSFKSTVTTQLHEQHELLETAEMRLDAHEAFIEEHSHTLTTMQTLIQHGTNTPAYAWVAGGITWLVVSLFVAFNSWDDPHGVTGTVNGKHVAFAAHYRWLDNGWTAFFIGLLAGLAMVGLLMLVRGNGSTEHAEVHEHHEEHNAAAHNRTARIRRTRRQQRQQPANPQPPAAPPAQPPAPAEPAAANA